MAYIQINDCMFNLQHVETIEFSATMPDEGKQLSTVVIGMASGRVWTKRDLTPAQVEDCKAQIARAIEAASSGG